MTELDIINEFFNRIRADEILFYTKYKVQDEEARQEWDEIHFNDIEFFCFLVNEGYVKDKKLISFFDGAIIKWYEKLYVEHFSKEERNNPEHYKEFNKHYNTIKKNIVKEGDKND